MTMSQKQHLLNKNGSTRLGRVGLLLIIIGVVIIGASVFTTAYQSSKKEELLHEFAQAQKAAEGEFLNIPDDEKDSGAEYASIEKGDTLCLLRIPSIDLIQTVAEGTDGLVLHDSLGHMMETAYPGIEGNCVIAGHRNYSFGAFFNRLDEVVIGDEIYVDTLTQTYCYEVTEVKVVDPEEVEILDDYGDERLTLFTCTPIYVATQRLVIVAKRVD